MDGWIKVGLLQTSVESVISLGAFPPSELAPARCNAQRINRHGGTLELFAACTGQQMAYPSGLLGTGVIGRSPLALSITDQLSASAKGWQIIGPGSQLNKSSSWPVPSLSPLAGWSTYLIKTSVLVGLAQAPGSASATTSCNLRSFCGRLVSLVHLGLPLPASSRVLLIVSPVVVHPSRAFSQPEPAQSHFSKVAEALVQCLPVSAVELET